MDNAPWQSTADAVSSWVDTSGVWVVMRHAPRAPIEAPTLRAAVEAPLTNPGREMARALGDRLPETASYRALYSPVPRCGETARLMLDSARARGAAVTDDGAQHFLLGPFVHDERTVLEALVTRGGRRFLQDWFGGAFAASAIEPPREAGRMVLNALLDAAPLALDSGHGEVCLAVTHDLVVAAVLAYLCGEQTLMLGWPPCLSGVVLRPLPSPQGDATRCLGWRYVDVSGEGVL